MRFEELAYAVDGLPTAVRFHARLTVVCLPEEERADWMARLFGVLEGTRAGDSTSVVYVDRRGRRIGLHRDHQGSATLIELATGAELPYSAGHLSLDGRFDWFASNGLTFRAESDLILVGSGVFTGRQKYDPKAIEVKLDKARKRLVRAGGRLKSATKRSARRDELLDRIAALDEQLTQETRQRLAGHLTGLGFSIDGTDDLAAGAEWVATRVGEADKPSVDDTRRLIAERRKLAQALQRVERNLPDIAGLAHKLSAVEQDVAALETALNAGRSLVSAQEAEMILVRRAAEAGRNDRRREPLPIVVDDALAPFGISDKRRLLDAVARVAETSQVVYLTDDPATLSWARAQAAHGELGLWGTDEVATVGVNRRSAPGGRPR